MVKSKSIQAILRYYTNINQVFRQIIQLILTSYSYINDKILKGFDDGRITGMMLVVLQKTFDTYHVCQTGLSLLMLKIITQTLVT